MFSGAKLACRDVGASARFVGCDKGCDGASVSVPKPKPSENPKSTSFILRCLEISVVSCCFASRGKVIRVRSSALPHLQLLFTIYDQHVSSNSSGSKANIAGDILEAIIEKRREAERNTDANKRRCGVGEGEVHRVNGRFPMRYGAKT